jgi:hypothetical protein
VRSRLFRLPFLLSATGLISFLCGVAQARVTTITARRRTLPVVKEQMPWRYCINAPYTAYTQNLEAYFNPMFSSLNIYGNP